MIQASQDILQRVYGHSAFRPNQAAIIKSVLDGKDTLALLPTGGGKSLCYQIPGIQLPGVCIVVSPLVALIKDQVDQLKTRGIKAIGITGGMRTADLDAALDNCIYGNYDFLYLSPERLQQALVQERILKMKVNLIAIDEAHCISQWGHDFRPAYREVHLLRELHPKTPIIAVTATATPAVQQDMLEALHMKDPQVFQSSYERSNISYQVERTADKQEAMLHFYQKHTGSSITYVRSRKNAVHFAKLLQDHRIPAHFYHGGMNNELREKTARAWMKSDLSVMVATNAFGMGIDKPDVRSVVHLQLPDSVESYYQETGRAGRDGQESIARFIYNLNDLEHAYNQFVKTQPSVDFLKKVYRKLSNYLNIALGEGAHQNYQLSFSKFCGTYHFSGLQCYAALMALDRFSVISLSQGYHRRSRIRFRESSNRIIEFVRTRPEVYAVIQAILRTYGSSSNQETEINTALIATRSKQTEQEVINSIKLLHQHELLEASIIDCDTQITYLEPRDDDRTINRFSKLLNQQNQLKVDKLQALIKILTHKKNCLNRSLLLYLGEEVNQDCGKCSNCLKVQTPSNLEDKILHLLKRGDLNTIELIRALEVSQEQVIKVLRNLLERKVITSTLDNKYHIK